MSRADDRFVSSVDRRWFGEARQTTEDDGLSHFGEIQQTTEDDGPVHREPGNGTGAQNVYQNVYNDGQCKDAE